MFYLEPDDDGGREIADLFFSAAISAAHFGPLISVRLFSQWAAGENATECFQKRLICKEKVVQILQTNKEEQNRSVYHGQTPSI